MSESLLEEARKFNKPALASIYEQYSQQIFRYAFHLLGDSELAEECVSETFSRFLRALKDGRGPNDHLQAYLYRIAHNWIADYYRRQPPPSEPLDLVSVSDASANPAQVMVQKLEHERVRNALAYLTLEQQKVIVLKFLEGWTYDEIASLIGKSIEATRVLQHRGLITLRRHLFEKEE